MVVDEIVILDSIVLQLIIVIHFNCCAVDLWESVCEAHRVLGNKIDANKGAEQKDQDDKVGHH